MEFIPNLHFYGECEAAIELYERAFQARRVEFLRYADANPKDWQAPQAEESRGKVYHAELKIGTQRVFLNDTTEPIPYGIQVSILVALDSREEVLAAYEVLQEGASLLTPLHETTYSSAFVSLVDRYGVRWELIKEV